MSIVWEEPEVKTRQKSKSELLFDALILRPGDWGRMGTAKNFNAAYQRAFKIRNDAQKMGVGRFEFTARKLKNNQGAIYGRFLGDLTHLPDHAYRDVGFTISTK